MITYDIFYSCKECGEEHPLGVKIPLSHGPGEKISIGAFYTGKEIPEKIRQLLEHSLECPKTLDGFFHDDRYEMYLVPVA
jgi:hypothetical protein